MKLAQEFKSFLLKQNALALTVGVAIGAAVGKVVTGAVDDLFMPLVGLILPGGHWRKARLVLVGTNSIRYGDFLGRCIDFIVVSFVVFLIVKYVLKHSAFAPATKQCPYCFEMIHQKATKCRACTSAV